MEDGTGIQEPRSKRGEGGTQLRFLRIELRLLDPGGALGVRPKWVSPKRFAHSNRDELMLVIPLFLATCGLWSDPDDPASEAPATASHPTITGIH